MTPIIFTVKSVIILHLNDYAYFQKWTDPFGSFVSSHNNKLCYNNKYNFLKFKKKKKLKGHFIKNIITPSHTNVYNSINFFSFLDLFYAQFFQKKVSKAHKYLTRKLLFGQMSEHHAFQYS